MIAAQDDLTGPRFLAAVTSLLQRARQISPTGGLWEAADFQWWSRADQHQDSQRSLVWSDAAGPVAAVVITRWPTSYGLDLLRAAERPGLDVLWPAALDLLRPLGDLPVEMAIRDDEPELIELAANAGFTPDGESGAMSWLDAGRRPAVSPLEDGFTLTSRREGGDRPHHMIKRNGPDVARRLAECSLYRPELDLALLTGGGEVAGYGLFWADPVTGVGLVEPMRTEDDYQGRGLARHVLTSGLDRLAGAGCSRLKISFVDQNPAARHLYLSAGFEPAMTDRSYTRSADS